MHNSQLPRVLLVLVTLALSSPSAPTLARDAIAERMQEFAAAQQFAGCVTLVANRGKIVHLEAVGRADLETGRAMAKDSLFAIASMTKPITATALMILQDEGKLSIDDPVAKYVPQFKDVALASGPAKTEMTIRHLLTHTSGLGGEQRCIGSLQETVEELATRELKFEPGTKWQYSPGLNVCGRIIEVVSGEAYEEFLVQRIFDPLQMVDTTFTPNNAQRERIAKLYQPSEDKKSLAPASHWITDLLADVVPTPSGGLFSTASDLAAFYQMILNGGELDGKRIVSEAAVKQMTTIQTGDLVTGFTPGNGWGLGWCVVREPQGVTEHITAGTFGHGGAFGTQGWVDPVTRTIYVLMIQRTKFGNSDGSDIRGEFHRLAANIDEVGAARQAYLAKKMVTAGIEGDLEQLKSLQASGVDVDVTLKHGLSAYQGAQMRGHEAVAKWLAEHGADTERPFADPSVYVEAVLSEVTRPNAPGVAVLVSRGGKILFSKGFGLANTADKVPVTPETKFRIGSVTKQFTAAAILKLQEQGKLSVDDKLTKFIPDYPRGEEVTLHHLLTHTSGITSYTSKVDFYEKVTQPIEPADLIASFKQDKFDFDPGEKWSYSNSGYFLLGYIIEQVSGKSYGEYLANEFFKPLGMHDTGVHRAGVELEHEAKGYSYANRKFTDALNWNMSHAGAAGALYSTVGDLHRWNEGIFGGKVLTQASLDAAFTRAQTDSDDNPLGYGYGWMIASQRGLKTIGHGGGLQGFTSYLARFPEQQLTIAVLHNALPSSGAIAPAGIVMQTAEFYLWEQMRPQTRPDVDPSVDPKSYPALVGRYDYGGAVLIITMEADHLFAQLTGQPRFEIFPASPSRFFWKVVEAEIEILRDDQGKVVAVQHTQGGRSFKAAKLPDEKVVEVATEVLDGYAGTYDLNPLGKLVVTRKGDHLLAKLAGQPAADVYPKTQTIFFYKIIKAELEFFKDEEGKIEKLILRQGPVKLEATRVD